MCQDEAANECVLSVKEEADRRRHRRLWQQQLCVCVCVKETAAADSLHTETAGFEHADDPEHCVFAWRLVISNSNPQL